MVDLSPFPIVVGRMTRDEILALEAGRETDALVAKSLGYQVFERHDYHYIATDKAAFEQGMTHGLFMEDFTHPDTMRLCQRLERYSTSIAAAWEVVGKLTMGGNGYFELSKDFGGRWGASFSIVLSDDDERRKSGYGNWKYGSEGDTASLAICRAALLAVMDL